MSQIESSPQVGMNILENETIIYVGTIYWIQNCHLRRFFGCLVNSDLMGKHEKSQGGNPIFPILVGDLFLPRKNRPFVKKNV